MEIIAPIGFGISVVQARTILISIKNRIKNYREGPKKYEALNEKVDDLDRQIESLYNLLEKFPSALPSDIRATFSEVLESVNKYVDDILSTIERSLHNKFGGSKTVVAKIGSKVDRSLRANELAAKMENVEVKINRTSDQLQRLFSMLATALKVDESQDIVTSKIDDVFTVAQENREILRSANAAVEDYSYANNCPDLSHAITLDFDSKDTELKPTTLEGLLKQFVLYSTSSGNFSAATGAVKRAYGVLGMPGVGKTVALQGLGRDEEVKQRFSDGILYMTFGRTATVQTAISETAKIMTLTGATTTADIVRNSTHLKDAVDYAVMWFKRKSCLFLLDDLWPAGNMPPGYFQELRQLMRESPKSRMAISTRSHDIAREGFKVDFGPRDPLGNTSKGIFMGHATSQSDRQTASATVDEVTPSMSKILSLCSGLPIALSVTGRAVSNLWEQCGSFETACDVYFAKLEKKRKTLGYGRTGGETLSVGILLCLEYLEVEFSKLVSENLLEINQNISDLYTSLCILPNQAWVPVSVLRRLWNLDEDVAYDIADLFRGMSLAKLEWRRPLSGGRNVAGILLHDLQLDFCQEQAMKTNALPRWHAQLLNGYLEATSMPMAELQGTQISHSTTSFMSRPWWSNEVAEDGYIHSNLCRHLSRAEFDIELGALLRDGRWTELRTKIGGVLALESDFKMLNNVHQRLDDDVRQGFNAISRAVQLSRGRMIKGLRVFQFHVFERLMSFSKSNAIVDAYIKSVGKYTPKPFLLPVRSFLEVNPALITKISVEGFCGLVSCSPCGLYIAANSGFNIVVVSSSGEEILKRLRGHTSYVRGIAFAEGSKKIVAGSYDGKIMVWEWESSESPVQVLDGKDSLICSVYGGQNFFCSFGDTVRIWNTSTGAQECVLPQCNGALCVAFCEKGGKLAIGFSGGRLKVFKIHTKEAVFENTAAHERELSCMSFSPNGSVLATGSWDGIIRLWNSDTGSRTGEFLEGCGVDVTCIAFRADGKQLASISRDFTIRVWDVETRNCVQISPTEDCWGFVGPIKYSVSFIGDGKRIVAGLGDDFVRIWDPSIGTEAKQVIYRLTDCVLGLAISRNGLQVVSVSKDRTVRLWDSRTGEQIGEPMISHKDWLTCVTFSRDGGQLVTCGFDGILKLWDTEGKSLIGDAFNEHMGSLSCVLFTKGSRSADGLHIVSGSFYGTVRVWNAQTHKQIGTAMEENTSTFVCLSRSADGCRIDASSSKTIIWNLENRAMIWKSNNVEENDITDDEAEKIIRESFPGSTAELYCEHGAVYCNFLGKKLLLADLPFEYWTYNSERKVFAAGMHSGAIAICKLRIE